MKNKRKDHSATLWAWQRALLKLVRMNFEDFETNLKKITEIDAQTIHVDRVSIWKFNEQKTAIDCLDLFYRSQKIHEKGLQLKACHYPNYFKVLEKQFYILSHDALSDILLKEFVKDYFIPNHISSMMDVPIWLEGKIVGILCHEHTGQKRTWTTDELGFANSVARIVSMLFLVDQRLKTDQQLRTVNCELKRLNDTRLAFTSMVSHELRTPLSAIKTGIDLVLSGVDGMLNESQKENLVIAITNVDRLSRLIDDILDFTRLEVGKIQMEFKQTSLNQLLNEVYTLMKMELDHKEILFTKNFPFPEIWAMCDADKMKTVVINLIHNAMKFTKPGGKIDVSLFQTDQQAEMRVSDTGIGIDKGAQEIIFELFEQGPTPRIWKSSSSGVGLAVCKLIVEQHGGTISVKSAPDSGACFTVRIPLGSF